METMIDSYSFCCSSVTSSAKYTSVTTGFPVVNVPVLSKATAVKSDKFDKYDPPLNKTPRLARLLIAERVAGMSVAANAHGDVAIRKRSEEHTSELQSRGHIVCRLLL